MKKLTAKSINSFIKKIPDETIEIPVSVGDKEIVFEFKSFLSIEEQTAFINRVVNSVVKDNDIMPEYLDVIFFTTLLQMISNVEIPRSEDDYVDLETINIWMHKTGLFERLLAVKFIADLKTMVDNKIAFMLQGRSATDEAIEEVYGLMRDIRAIVNGIAPKIKKFDPEKSLDKLQKTLTPENMRLIQGFVEKIKQ